MLVEGGRVFYTQPETSGKTVQKMAEKDTLLETPTTIFYKTLLQIFTCLRTKMD